MRTLYFDCFSGISGDMTIGALLDLGLDFDYLKAELRKLPLDGYEIQQTRVVRANLSAMKFDVVVEGDSHSHDDHSHHHHDHHHSGSHAHRKASEIIQMIQSSGLSPSTRRIATGIFTKLAISEGKVHHVSPEDVEFHEVGALDSILDTVGVAIGFDALGIEKFVCSPINVGSGFIHCQHGVYPVPAPATADLLRQATIYSKHVNAELVTPTGAAILAAVVTEFSGLNDFSIDRIGYGAGTKQFQDFPNCLRLFLGGEGSERAVVEARFDEIEVIEANIDDTTPQNLAYVTDRLIEAGALDVSISPILMKKGRSGQLIQVLAPLNRIDVLRRVLFEETTTIGVRSYTARRVALERELVQASTPYGNIPVKVSRLDGRVMNFVPEFEDCARIAREHKVALKEVQSLAIKGYLERP